MTTNSPSPATVTTTMTNGQVVTGTTFGVQALSQTASASGNSGNVGASFVSTRVTLGVFGGVAASVFGAMVML